MGAAGLVVTKPSRIASLRGSRLCLRSRSPQSVTADRDELHRLLNELPEHEIPAVLAEAAATPTSSR